MALGRVATFKQSGGNTVPQSFSFSGFFKSIIVFNYNVFTIKYNYLYIAYIHVYTNISWNDKYFALQ
jgi:hypothetical protein